MHKQNIARRIAVVATGVYNNTEAGNFNDIQKSLNLLKPNCSDIREILNLLKTNKI